MDKIELVVEDETFSWVFRCKEKHVKAENDKTEFKLKSWPTNLHY